MGWRASHTKVVEMRAASGKGWMRRGQAVKLEVALGEELVGGKKERKMGGDGDEGKKRLFHWGDGEATRGKFSGLESKKQKTGDPVGPHAKKSNKKKKCMVRM